MDAATTDPSLKGTEEGRDATNGRFVKGWKGGPGNPHARKSNELRAAIYENVSREDMGEMVRALVEKAKEGDIQAFRELIPWLLGKPDSADLAERIDELETLLREVAAAQNAPRAVPGPDRQRATA